MTDQPSVPAPYGWHTVDTARIQWVDAMHLDDEQLEELLAAARIQCEAYAPAVVGEVPVNYRQAQLLQARNLWQAIKTDQGGDIGPDGYAVPVYAMDRVVKGLLRPKRGVPYVR
ncbi:hypothetical protein ABID81_002967 [Frigoribacterium sp. PvP054]|uniref:hypothetical protein n=1 Tax=Frigoribacterium sp. PvP054 TaxID=3156438 RepID=UPI00339A47BA